MKYLVIVVMGISLLSCSDNKSGPQQCIEAGGQCLIGSVTGMGLCPNVGPQDCNPDRNPGGAVCCLPCPNGTKATDAGNACM